MDSVVVGVILVLGFVGIQYGMRYLTLLRTKKAWEQARISLKGGDLAAAEKGLLRCVKLMPLWLQPRYLLGGVLAMRGNLDAAEEQLKLAQALNPREPEGHVELGIFYVTAAGRIADGVASFREALAHGETVWTRLETDPRLQAFRATEAFATLQSESGAR